MKTLILTFFITIFLSILGGDSQNNYTDKDFKIFKGPYLGQETPGITPKLFAPEIFSKTQPEWAFCTEFSADGKEFYFTECDTVKNIDRIMYMKQINNTWTKPDIVSFSGLYNDNDLRLSPDGNIIFWRSWRPLPGSETPEKRSIIWFSTRAGNGWSTAKPLKYSENYLVAGYPAITNEGKLYFSARLKNNIGESDIYFSYFSNDQCSNPKNLGPTINTKYIEGDLYIAPDESFLIVSCWNRPDNNGDSDLYISFRNKNGHWTKLKNMGEPINTENNENCPSFSPNGKYFFYMSAKVNEKPAKTYTYWVDAKIIEKLKPGDL